ncbi:hypothetical protein ACF0H5_006974 [Mactra antiquata]
MKKLVIMICTLVVGLSYTMVEAYSCYSCRGEVDKPSDCDHQHDCDHYCMTELRLHHGERQFKVHCEHECTPVRLEPTALIGKRNDHDLGSESMIEKRRPDDVVLCRECCHSGSCQLRGCQTVHTTTSPQLHLWIHFHRNSTTTTEKPMTTTKTTTSKPTTETTIKTTTTTMKTTTTAKATTSTTTIAKPVTHEAISTQVPAVTSPNTNNTCVDIEHLTFSCDQWKSLGFCEAVSGAGHIIALENCRKTCGYCH